MLPVGDSSCSVAELQRVFSRVDSRGTSKPQYIVFLPPNRTNSSSRHLSVKIFFVSFESRSRDCKRKARTPHVISARQINAADRAKSAKAGWQEPRAEVGANLARERGGGANRVAVNVDGDSVYLRVTASHNGCSGCTKVGERRKKQVIAARATILAQ